MQYTPYQKPYFAHCPVDFNISHAGQYVVCAIGSEIRLGIDIEEVKWIDITEMDAQFSKEETRFIKSDGDSLLNFYSLWTRKEAIIKANGKGLNLPLREITVMDNIVHVEHERWFLTEIDISVNYRCHLATSVVPASAIKIIDYRF